MKFDTAPIEWLDMGVCRSNIAFSLGYDIVSGKIADDNIGENYFLRFFNTIFISTHVEE